MKPKRRHWVPRDGEPYMSLEKAFIQLKRLYPWASYNAIRIALKRGKIPHMRTGDLPTSPYRIKVGDIAAYMKRLESVPVKPSSKLRPLPFPTAFEVAKEYRPYACRGALLAAIRSGKIPSQRAGLLEGATIFVTPNALIRFIDLIDRKTRKKK